VLQAVNIVNVSGQPLSAIQATFDSRIRNQSNTEVSGFDVTVSRTFETGWGVFGAGANVNYLMNFEANASEGAPLADIVDTIYNPVDLRGRINLSWSLGGWSAALFANYTDDYTDNQVVAAPVQVDAWTTYDLNLGYRFGDSADWLRGVSLRFNAQNLLDEEPPTIIDRGSAYGSPGYDTANADALGRLISLTVSKTW